MAPEIVKIAVVIALLIFLVFWSINFEDQN